MSTVAILGLTIFILVLFAGIFSIIFGLPGTVIILIDVIIYAWLTDFETIGFKTILMLAFLALSAELIDFFIGIIGAQKYGASKRGVVASIIGGIAGAILMTPFFFGLGAILGAFLGGFAGAFLVEWIDQHRLKPAFRAGYGALLGKIGGVLCKGFLAIVMTIISLSAIYS